MVTWDRLDKVWIGQILGEDAQNRTNKYKHGIGRPMTVHNELHSWTKLVCW